MKKRSGEALSSIEGNRIGTKIGASALFSLKLGTKPGTSDHLSSLKHEQLDPSHLQNIRITNPLPIRPKKAMTA